MAGDDHHGVTIFGGRGNSADRIDQARPGGGHYHARSPRDPPDGLSHEGRAGFVAAHDVSWATLRQHIKDRQHGAARHAEDIFDTERLQSIDQ